MDMDAEFIHRVTLQMADDIDDILSRFNLDKTFADFPALLEWYRKMMVVAWLDGAAWAYTEGLNVGGELVTREIQRKIKELEDKG